MRQLEQSTDWSVRRAATHPTLPLPLTLIVALAPTPTATLTLTSTPTPTLTLRRAQMRLRLRLPDKTALSSSCRACNRRLPSSLHEN